MKKFLSCKMGLFPLLLAKWNIKRHTTFVHSVRRLLRESTNTEILIACVCVCVFFCHMANGRVETRLLVGPGPHGGLVVNAFGWLTFLAYFRRQAQLVSIKAL